MEGRLTRRWLLPLTAAAVFFLALLLVIPYATGYGSSKMPLGIMIWKLCMAGETNHNTLDFSYCLFVPFIVAFLLFILRKQIAIQPIRGCDKAMGLILVGLLLYWFGLGRKCRLLATHRCSFCWRASFSGYGDGTFSESYFSPGRFSPFSGRCLFSIRPWLCRCGC